MSVRPFLLASIILVSLAAVPAVNGQMLEPLPLWNYRSGSYHDLVVMSSNAEYVVAGAYKDGLYLFSRESGTPLWHHKIGEAEDSLSPVVSTIAVSDDGRYVAAGVSETERWRVMLFSREADAPLQTYKLDNTPFSVALSSDGRYMAVGYGYGTVRLFSRDSQKSLWSYEAGKPVMSVAISSDGQYVVAASNDHGVYMFGRESGTPRWSYKAGGPIRAVAISSNPKYAVAGSADDSVYLLNVNTGIPLWSYRTEGVVETVAISADGNYVVAGSDDRSVYLFGHEGDSPLWSYVTGDRVNWVSISSDGMYIVTGSDRAYMFSRNSGIPLWIYSIPGEEGERGNEFLSVAVSSDGKYIAGAAMYAGVYLFDRDATRTVTATTQTTTSHSEKAITSSPVFSVSTSSPVVQETTAMAWFSALVVVAVCGVSIYYLFRKRRESVSRISEHLRYCINCRCKLPANAVFCDKCGTRQAEE